MAIVLAGGSLVSTDGVFRADLRMENGTIVDVGSRVGCTEDEYVDVSGRYLLPGGIDVHTHFDLPLDPKTRTADSFATGTRAALAGGVTCVVDYATQFRGESLLDGFRNWQALAHDSRCDYSFHMAITDWRPDVAAELPKMVELGVSSFKMYMAYKGSLQVDDGVLYEALSKMKAIGALLCVHCENGDVIAARCAELLREGKTAARFHPLSRPEEVETEAVNRLIVTADLAGAPVYVVHVSSAASMRRIVEAKTRGQRVYAETCPQYLYLDESLYTREYEDPFEAAKYVCSPPLRDASNHGGLWASLSEGLVDVVATDHCSFCFVGQKERGRTDFTRIPNGMPGVETRMLLLYRAVCEGRITLPQMVRLAATNPAVIFGLSPRKGALQTGADADVVVLDPEGETVIRSCTQHQNVDYSPFEGFRVPGSIESVYLRGNLLYHGGAFLTDEPIGRYIARGKSGTSRI